MSLGTPENSAIQKLSIIIIIGDQHTSFRPGWLGKLDWWRGAGGRMQDTHSSLHIVLYSYQSVGILFFSVDFKKESGQGLTSHCLIEI